MMMCADEDRWNVCCLMENILEFVCVYPARLLNPGAAPDRKTSAGRC